MDDINQVLNRMVDNLIAYDEIPFLDDVQYIWRRGWKLEDVVDPKDNDPLRYALKACILERLAEVLSMPPRNVETQAPDWCEKVPAVQTSFSVISEEYRSMFEGDLASPIFAKRNIFAPKEFMYFI